MTKAHTSISIHPGPGMERESQQVSYQEVTVKFTREEAQEVRTIMAQVWANWSHPEGHDHPAVSALHKLTEALLTLPGIEVEWKAERVSDEEGIEELSKSEFIELVGELRAEALVKYAMDTKRSWQDTQPWPDDQPILVDGNFRGYELYITINGYVSK